MTINFEPPRVWATEPRKIAVQLRKSIHLPGVAVQTRKSLIDVSWVDGPPMAPVRRELLGQMPYEYVSVWVRRLYSPAVFGAALTEPSLDGTTGWDRIRPALKHLHSRDLTKFPFAQADLELGQSLADLAGVPWNQTIECRGRNRWDYQMADWLGDGLEAALRAAHLT